MDKLYDPLEIPPISVEVRKHYPRDEKYVRESSEWGAVISTIHNIGIHILMGDGFTEITYSSKQNPEGLK